MPRVFISYAWEDGSEVANWLYEQLGVKGIEAFIDKRDLNVYKSFKDELKREIAKCTHLVVCGTKDLEREGSYCQDEIKQAKELRKPIIPLNLGYIPESIEELTYIPFEVWNVGIERLLARLYNDERINALTHLQGFTEDTRFNEWAEVYLPLKSTTTAHLKSLAAMQILATQKRTIRKTIRHTDEAALDDEITIETFEDLYKYIRGDYRRAALIGDPGAGKTTTLKRVAFELAQAAKTCWKTSIPSDQQQIANPLPVFVELGGYKRGSFEDYINSSFGKLRLADYLPNRVVFLLDGLNEISVERARHVQEWVDGHRDTSIIVTCRKLNYDGLLLCLHRIDIHPLDLFQINAFIERILETKDAETLFWGLAGEETAKTWEWYNKSKVGSFKEFWFGKEKVGNRADQEQKTLDKLRRRLSDQRQFPGLLGVVSNPYLLTLVIKIYEEKQRLPKNRHDIFDEFVGNLMEERGKLAEKSGLRWIDEEVQKGALSRLAHQMQSDTKPRAAEKAYALKHVQAACPGYDAEHLLTLAASAGILDCGENVQFKHQLLQEYFAANVMYDDIKRGVPANRYFPGENWWEVTGWEETAILVAGMAENERGEVDATTVVKWLTPVHPMLAFRCATDSGAPCSPDALQPLFEPAAGARRCPIARATWGRLLANEGKDKRRGIGSRNCLPDIAWCKVPAGNFSMGGDQGVARTYWKGDTFEIGYDYYISKYPVTYAQYEPFVDGGGYSDRCYWTEAGWTWRTEKNIAAPAQWRNPFFHIANHPVVGLSWYECYAYTQWLSKRLGYMVRLPTEPEWEKAARSPDARFFPWGSDYVVGAANVDETNSKAVVGPYQVNRTTAVGLYDHTQNPIGICDMSGNVWEWCLSSIQAEYQHHMPEEIEVEGDTRRETRGGSWKNDVARSRSAYRGSNPPKLQDQTDGMRLAHQGYELTLEEWQKRVEQVKARVANMPKALLLPRVSGQVVVLHDEGGRIAQADGTKVPFDPVEIEHMADYPEEYRILPGCHVEYEVENGHARKLTLILRGRVDDWDRERAYGDIITSTGDRIYMHQSVIIAIEDWREMKDGDTVEFELVQGYLYGMPSFEARNVRIVRG